MRVLLAEDDPRMARRIAGVLPTAGIDVTGVVCGEAMLTAHAEDRFDALVLDLDTTGAGGLGIIARLRTVEADVPVLLITSASAVEHRVAGLNAGADDYLVKPFDVRELAARLHALIRRTQGRCAHLIEAGPLRLDPASGLAWLGQAPVALSRREIDLLACLASHRGRWVPPDTLHARLYGMTARVRSNVLNVHIHNVRRKLGGSAIQTSRGLGYRLGWALAIPEPATGTDTSVRRFACASTRWPQSL